MKEHDRIVLINDKDYLKYGVEKDMVGIIIDHRKTDGAWMVLFDRFGELPDVAMVDVKEEDMQIIYVVDRPIKSNDRVMLLCEKDKYSKHGLYPNMDGWVVSSDKINGKWMVEFGRFDSMPELGEVFGNLPGLITVPIDEVDLKVYALVDEYGNEITEVTTNN